MRRLSPAAVNPRVSQAVCSTSARKVKGKSSDTAFRVSGPFTTHSIGRLDGGPVSHVRMSGNALDVRHGGVGPSTCPQKIVALPLSQRAQHDIFESEYLLGYGKSSG